MKIKKIGVLLFIIIVSAGCAKIDIPPEDESKIIEYGVNAVINHDKNYIVKMAEVETQEEVETTTWWSDDGTSNKETSENISGIGETTVSDIKYSMNQLMNISGFDFEYTGYLVTNTYPESGSQLGFNMMALSGYDLMIVKFNVTNTLKEPSDLDIIDLGYTYKGIINKESKVNAQVTALLNGLNTWEGQFDAQETKELVLVFQIHEDISGSIAVIDLEIDSNGNTGTTSLKN